MDTVGDLDHGDVVGAVPNGEGAHGGARVAAAEARVGRTQDPPQQRHGPSPARRLATHCITISDILQISNVHIVIFYSSAMFTKKVYLYVFADMRFDGPPRQNLRLTGPFAW